MAAKKRMKKRTAKKSTTSKSISQNSKGKRFNKITNAFTKSLVIFIISLVLFKFIGNVFLSDLFFIIAVISGFVSLALIIAYLVVFFGKLFSKK